MQPQPVGSRRCLCCNVYDWVRLRVIENTAGIKMQSSQSPATVGPEPSLMLIHLDLGCSLCCQSHWQVRQPVRSRSNSKAPRPQLQTAARGWRLLTPTNRPESQSQPTQRRTASATPKPLACRTPCQPCHSGGVDKSRMPHPHTGAGTQTGHSSRELHWLARPGRERSDHIGGLPKPSMKRC